MVGSRVGEDDPGFELLGILEIHQRIGCDDDDVAHLYFACGGAVVGVAPFGCWASAIFCIICGA